MPALHTPEGQQGYQAVLDAKAAKTQRYRRVLAVVAVVLAGIYAAQWLNPGHDSASGWGWLAAATATALVAVAGSFTSWSEAEYYSVPGSRDAHGDHRCIHCGHRGIYRHGQYKSNTKYADCSRCKTNLWKE